MAQKYTAEEIAAFTPQQLIDFLGEDKLKQIKAKSSTASDILKKTISHDKFKKLMEKTDEAVDKLLITYKRLKQGNPSEDMINQFMMAISKLSNDNIDVSSEAVVIPVQGPPKGKKRTAE